MSCLLEISSNIVNSAIQVVPNLAQMANTFFFQLTSEGHISTKNRETSLLSERIDEIAQTALEVAKSAFESNKRLFSAVYEQISSFLNELEDTEASATPQNPWDPNFRNVLQHRKLIEDPANAWLEKFVKVDINTNIPPGTIVSIPSIYGNVSYKVHQKIAKEGLVSYALTPMEYQDVLCPLIAFRGTECNPFKEEAIPSIKNDVDTHIGEKGWNACKKDFENLVNDPSFRNKDQKMLIAGYSLGGAHAQYFIEEHFQHVCQGIFYNDPSINPKVAESFVEKTKSFIFEQPLILQIYRSVGDLCHHFGGKHLGWGIDHPLVKVQLLEIKPSQLEGFAFKWHNRRIFDTDQFNYAVFECCDPNKLYTFLDNAQRDSFSSFVESTRMKLSGFLSLSISSLEMLFYGMSKLLFKA